MNNDFYNSLMGLDMEIGTLLSGEAVVDREIEILKATIKPNTGAVVIQVGEDRASTLYINNKLNMCKYVGIEAIHHKLPLDVSEEELLKVIDKYNVDKTVHGILVQLPLPNHINESAVANAINSCKDIDCFTDSNIAKVFRGDEVIAPCTPQGIFTMLDNYGLSVEGKKVVVVGRSNIVGKPLINMLVNRGATVIACNSKTSKMDIINYAYSSDILISATGIPNFFNKEEIREVLGFEFDYLCDVIIDVGINRDSNNKLCGDVSKDLRYYTNYITPVPGGVGKTTVLELIKNIEKCRKLIDNLGGV